MKSLMLKMTLFLCLFAVLDLSAQCTPSKSTIKPATKTTTHAPAKKAPAKKPAPKATTTTANAKTNTDVITVGPAKTTTAPPANAAGAMPVMTFDKKTINFGNIKTGDRPEVTYNFTNTGNAPLDIDIVSGCDCTELDWTRSQVPAGGKGFVKAVFNSKKAEADDHKKPLKKYVDIVLKQMHPKTGNVLNSSVTFEVFIVD
jgi:Protein of unknown function (DUF1573)